jgi:perosamine synthetase
MLVPQEPAVARTNWQSYCVGLPAGTVQRDVMQVMLDAGIATRRGIMCSHREPAYAQSQRQHDLWRSEHAQDTTLILPLYVQMAHDEALTVVRALAFAIDAVTAAGPTTLAAR